MDNTMTTLEKTLKEETMKTFKLIRTAVGAGLLVLGLGLLKDAHAANPDTMTITVTPGGVNYAVVITSPQIGGYAFGIVNVGATTIATEAISVQNAGNISAYFSLGVVDTTGGGLAWTNSTSPANVTYTMQGLFNTTQPANGSFVGAGNNVPAAAPGTAANHFNQGTTKTLPGASANLWLQLQMPTGVADSSAHTLVLAITGQSS